MPPSHRAVLAALMEMEPAGGWEATSWVVTTSWTVLGQWVCSSRQTVMRLVTDLRHNGWIRGEFGPGHRAKTITLLLAVPEDPGTWEPAPERQKDRSASAERTAAREKRLAAASAHGRSTSAHGREQRPHTDAQRPHTDATLDVFPGQSAGAPGWVGVVPTVPTHNYRPPAEGAPAGADACLTAAAAGPALRAPGAQGRPGPLPINETSTQLPTGGIGDGGFEQQPSPRAGARPVAEATALPFNLEHLGAFDGRVRSAELGRLAPISVQAVWRELRGHQEDHDDRCTVCRSGYHCVEAITLGSLTSRLDACLDAP